MATNRKSLFFVKVLALFLCLVILASSLSGCASLIGLLRYYVTYAGYVEYFEEYQFNYTDQDYEDFRTAQDRLTTLLAYNSEGVRSDVNNAFQTYYSAYIRLGSQYQLSMLNYSMEPTDEDTVSAYETMTTRYNEAYSHYMEILTIILDSIYGAELIGTEDEGFIEFIRLRARSSTPEILELQNRNSELVLQQHELDSTSPDFASRNDELYREFTANNRKIASLLDYSNYMDYEGEMSYSRDFKMDEIRDFLVEFARSANTWYGIALDRFQQLSAGLTDAQTTELASLMYEAFYEGKQKERIQGFMEWMPAEFSGFYSDVNDKYQSIFLGSAQNNARKAAFTFTLMSTRVPVMYFGPEDYSSPFTFVHEFGHAFNQFETRERMAKTSLEYSETASQADEMLYLIYLEKLITDTKVYDVLRSYHLYSAMESLELALAVAMFEDEIYRTGRTDYDTVMEEVCSRYVPTLYAQVGTRLHTYIRQVTMDSPAYYLSYAISLIPCLELYMIASDSVWASDYRDMYITLVTDMDHTYVDALKHAGFSDPFRTETVRKLNEFYSK